MKWQNHLSIFPFAWLLSYWVRAFLYGKYFSDLSPPKCSLIFDRYINLCIHTLDEHLVNLPGIVYQALDIQDEYDMVFVGKGLWNEKVGEYVNRHAQWDTRIDIEIETYRQTQSAVECSGVNGEDIIFSWGIRKLFHGKAISDHCFWWKIIRRRGSRKKRVFWSEDRKWAKF